MNPGENPIEVVSVGPGHESLLTAQAARAIEGADVVFCAPRHAALVSDGAKVRPLSPFAAAMEQMDTLRAKGRRVAVLVSGDAGLYSLQSVLKTRFSRENLRVLPGVSALQAFMAALGLPWQNACILSAHGRALSGSALCHAVRTCGQVILFLDAAHNPAWVRAALDEGGLGQAALLVGERVSYPDQSIAPYTPRAYDALCMALVQNPAPEKGLSSVGPLPVGLPPVGLPDDAFARGKTPMTKREIRVLLLAALALPPDAVVWDVGAGTGSVSVECARQCPLGEVYAVERDAQALEWIAGNKARFHLGNLHAVPGEAPRALCGLPAPTHVFLGGTGGACGAVFAFLRSLRKPLRVAATAVTVESAAALTAQMRSLSNFSAVQAGISRLEPVGAYTMFRAQNPVLILSGDIIPEEETV